MWFWNWDEKLKPNWFGRQISASIFFGNIYIFSSMYSLQRLRLRSQQFDKISDFIASDQSIITGWICENKHICIPCLTSYMGQYFTQKQRHIVHTAKQSLHTTHTTRVRHSLTLIWHSVCGEIFIGGGAYSPAHNKSSANTPSVAFLNPGHGNIVMIIAVILWYLAVNNTWWIAAWMEQSSM